jgi:DNA-binding IclR family transcriptional regulator
MTLSALSRCVGLIPSTAHRLLATLAHRGYVRQDALSRRYSLGPAAHVLLGMSADLNDLFRLAPPHLQELARCSGETANLAVLRNLAVIFVDQIPSTHMVRAIPKQHVPLPLYATAAGKALLAWQTAATVQAYLRTSRPALTKNTLTSREDLAAALNEVRSQGFALDRGETEVDGRCVAAVVRGPSGEAVAALSLTAPAVRMTDARLKDLSRLVCRVAQRLSEELQTAGLTRPSEAVAEASRR